MKVINKYPVPVVMSIQIL